jgi:teichuronic acid biosynthesis glycosyltransferase TuaC
VAPPIRLLTFSTLYPNAAQPNHGVFVENRLRQLVASGAVEATVLAPVPYFPGRHRGDVPAQERRHGLTIHHPRFLAIPKLGMAMAPALLEAAAARAIGRLLAAGLRFDAIDAHYFFPEGVAAVQLGRRFGRPVVVTARGSDISLFPRFRIPRRLIRRALGTADAAVAVSAALKEAMVALGAAPAGVTVLRNGVDTALFRPATDRAGARAALGLTRPTLLSVGLLIERKGHHRVIEALHLLPDCDLVIVGEGPERARLEALAARLGVGPRVRLLGARPHAELAPIYTAADLLVLASSREGWANVLLEAMACGTPVVASPIWGNPEVVQSREAGLIARENTPAAIAASVRDLLADPPDRAATRAYAERFGWEATTEGQIALYRRVLAARGQAAETRTGSGSLPA